MPVKVNGVEISSERIEANMNQMRQDYLRVFSDKTKEEQEAELRQWAEENMIEQEVLRQAAQADPRPVDPKILNQQFDKIKEEYGGEEQFYKQMQLTHDDDKRILQDIETDLRIRRLTDETGAKADLPTETDARTYYQTNETQFLQPEVIHVAHIVKHVNAEQNETDAKAGIESVAEEIASGKTFEELANAHSDCGGNGGDLGYFPRGQMVQSFDDIVFQLDIDQVSPVFQTEFGFHIAKLYDRKPPALVPFETVKDQIITHLAGEKKTEQIEALLDELKGKADIERE